MPPRQGRHLDVHRGRRAVGLHRIRRQHRGWAVWVAVAVERTRADLQTEGGWEAFETVLQALTEAQSEINRRWTRALAFPEFKDEMADTPERVAHELYLREGALREQIQDQKMLIEELDEKLTEAERKVEELQRELGARIACTYPPSYTEMRDREQARLLREARVLEKLVQDLESASESQHEDGTPEGYLPGEVLHMIDEICQEVESEG